MIPALIRLVDTTKWLRTHPIANSVIGIARMLQNQQNQPINPLPGRVQQQAVIILRDTDVVEEYQTAQGIQNHEEDTKTEHLQVNPTTFRQEDTLSTQPNSARSEGRTSQDIQNHEEDTKTEHLDLNLAPIPHEDTLSTPPNPARSVEEDQTAQGIQNHEDLIIKHLDVKTVPFREVKNPEIMRSSLEHTSATVASPIQQTCEQKEMSLPNVNSSGTKLPYKKTEDAFGNTIFTWAVPKKTNPKPPPKPHWR